MIENTNKVFLVIGETGSGKSTFINTIGNYFNGGSLENLKVFIPNELYAQNCSTELVPSEVPISQGRSTKHFQIYTFFDKDGSQNLSFIDTPGFGSLLMPNNALQQVILDAVRTHERDLCGIIYIFSSTLDRGNKIIPNMVSFLKNSLPEYLHINSLHIYTKSYETVNDFRQLGIQSKTPSNINMQNSAFHGKGSKSDWKNSMEIISEEILPVLRDIKKPNKIIKETSMLSVSSKYNSISSNQFRTLIQTCLSESYDPNTKILLLADITLRLSTVKSILEQKYMNGVISCIYLFAFEKMIFDVDKFSLPSKNVIVLTPDHDNSLGSSFGIVVTPIFYLVDSETKTKSDFIFQNLYTPKPESSLYPFVLLKNTFTPTNSVGSVLDMYSSEAFKLRDYIGEPIVTHRFINSFYTGLFNSLKLENGYTLDSMFKRYKEIDTNQLVDNPSSMVESYTVFYDFINVFQMSKSIPSNDQKISLLYSCTQSKITQLQSFIKPPPPINNIKLFMDEVVASGMKDIQEAEHQRMVSLCKNEYEGSLKEKIAECRDYLERINLLINNSSSSFTDTISSVKDEINSMIKSSKKDIEKLEQSKKKCKFNLFKSSVLIGLNLVLFAGCNVIPFGRSGITLIEKSMNFIQDPNMKEMGNVLKVLEKIDVEADPIRKKILNIEDKKEEKKEGAKDGKDDGKGKDKVKDDKNGKEGSKDKGKEGEEPKEKSSIKKVQGHLKNIMPIFEQVEQMVKNWNEMEKIVEKIDKLKEAIEKLTATIEQTLPKFSENLMKVLSQLSQRQKELSNSSATSRKYQVIELSERYKQNLKYIGEVLKFLPNKEGYESFVQIFEELKLYLNVSMDINDKIEDYKDHIQMIGYMANISTKSPSLANDQLSLELITQTKLHLVMEKYHQGTKGFLQCMFPFGLEVISAFQYSNNYSSQGQGIIQAMKDDIKSIQKYINIGLSQINRNITDNVLKRQFDSNTPFYKWTKANHKGFINRIQVLFAGEAVTFYADIDRVPQMYSATKFQTIKLHIGHPDPKVNETIQKSISQLFFELTHSGKSYYQFNQTKFLMVNDYCTFKYQLSSNDKVLVMNSTMELLAQSEPILSPYTYWTFKIRGIKEHLGRLLGPNDFINLELSLIGLGQFVDSEKYVYDKTNFDKLYSNYIVIE
ncbi:hypothetical protein PPL_11091 [Heterostelium album PN500]|uniref:G domain-containing protein n=1 Tax=Heterostelium pallidum (strain ATCC 26659 / Pp 5 / PN500) TaxID=670386 RepID=D3BSX1_HETP5|nr:hypothetical protein PPL_11091 [Heterostelium album PN500]EFA75586.1 hypothetical protein PPL_11091 [Heterostelium album PN500]|eukprot:XP_020427720.1 hypothetical protein PPL_11091 [Heterostelium album PN500]